MTAWRMLMLLGWVLVVVLVRGAAAQDVAYDEAHVVQQEELPPAAGFWPTERMMELAIDRLTEEMSQHYGFSEDQLWETRAVIKDRFPEWFQANRPRIQRLMNHYIEVLLEAEPPSPEEMAEWAGDVLPLAQEFVGLLDLTVEDMRVYMTDEQQVLLDGEQAALHVGVRFATDRLHTWAEGGYDPERDWPGNPNFKAEQREREDRLRQEAEEARRAAMGLKNLGAQVGDPDQPTSAPVRPALSPDEWEEFVEAFIRRYQLNERQASSARRYLREAQDARDRYLRRHLAEIRELEERLEAAQTDAQREEIRAEYQRINAPLDRHFQRLSDKLERLPTRRQRADTDETPAAGDTLQRRIEAELEPKGGRPAGAAGQTPAQEVEATGTQQRESPSSP